MALPAAPPGISPNDARLAWELTAGISSIGDIMRRHRLTFDEYDAKKRDPVFMAMFTEYKKYWDSDMSAAERVQLKAALLTEDSLLDIYELIKSDDTAPGVKLEAFTSLARAAQVGVKGKDGAPTSGERVQININLPGRQGVTIDAPAITVEKSNDE